ncbi:MAG: T9SS type A sorting domain-containing protein [Ignavibacteriae bacterium]|nr:T9SS type A sorting domain-containing protein [Ignavibacteriota bacterium]
MKRFVMIIFFTTALIINAQTTGMLNGKIVEIVTERGLKGQEVKIYYNGKTEPTQVTTNNEGMFDIITGIEESKKETAENKITFNYENNKLRINTESKLTIFDILGRKVKSTELKAEEPITINNLSSGKYILKVTTENKEEYVNEISVIEGKINGIKWLEQKRKHKIIELRKENKLTEDGTTIDSIIINSPRVKGIPQAKDTTIIDGKTYTDITDLGTIELEGKNIIKGYIYDLETNEPADNGKAFLSSTPTKTYDLNNGWYEFTTTQNNTDTIKITMPNYYNITHPIKIQMGTTEVYGINDNQGILNLKIQTDNNAIRPIWHEDTQTWEYHKESNDYMEYLQDITEIRNTGYENHQEYNFTKTRFKENPIKVWINRADAPNEEYSNATLNGILGLENNDIKFEETTDKTNAQLRIVDYKNPNLGNGVQIIYDFDEQGPYLKQWDISLNRNLTPDQIKYVTGHEAIRSLFTSTGLTSPFASDVMYGRPLTYMDFAIDGALCSEKEKTTTEWIYNAPRNTKWLEYSK